MGRGANRLETYRFLALLVQAWNRIPARAKRGLLQRTSKTRFASPLDSCKIPLSGINLARRPPDMSIETHLAELSRRHQALEQQISEARQHPSVDDLTIVELKRRKLQVKDEIA